MNISPMSAEQCHELLAHVGFGRLACAKNNQPYIVPTYVACHDGNIYGFSLFGQKINWMRANPRVCLEADEVKGQFDWKTVIATGRYEELTDDPRFNEERVLAQSLLQQRYMAWQTPYEISQKRKADEGGAPILYSIRIEEITGLTANPKPLESTKPF